MMVCVSRCLSDTSGPGPVRRRVPSTPARTRTADCWYAPRPATRSDVGSARACAPSAPRSVLYRTTTARPSRWRTADAHRAYPLRPGTRRRRPVVRADCAASRYDADGQCVSVPDPARVPLGAHVAAYPVRSRTAWSGSGSVSPAGPACTGPPSCPGSTTTTGDAGRTSGGRGRLPAPARELRRRHPGRRSWLPRSRRRRCRRSDPAARGRGHRDHGRAAQRDYPPAPLAALAGRDARRRRRRRRPARAGRLLPRRGLWADHWDATYDGGSARLRFTQLVTPVDATSSRPHWRVSRELRARRPAADAGCTRCSPTTTAGSRIAMETAQRVLAIDGPRAEVNVAADVAALRVREIVARHGGRGAIRADPTTRHRPAPPTTQEHPCPT